MANIYEPSDDQKKEWDAWVASRPDGVRELAARFPPWKLYRLSTTKQRVFVIGFFEDLTLRVAVTKEYNFLVTCERQVFGIDPDNLTECDLPVGLMDPGRN